MGYKPDLIGELPAPLQGAAGDLFEAGRDYVEELLVVKKPPELFKGKNSVHIRIKMQANKSFSFLLNQDQALLLSSWALHKFYLLFPNSKSHDKLFSYL